MGKMPTLLLSKHLKPLIRMSIKEKLDLNSPESVNEYAWMLFFSIIVWVVVFMMLRQIMNRASYLWRDHWWFLTFAIMNNRKKQ